MVQTKKVSTKSKKTVKKEDFTPLLALRDVVVFPYMVIPLFIGRKKSLKAVERAMEFNRKIILATQIDPTIENPKKNDLNKFGCEAEILQMLKLPDGTFKILIEGKARVKINNIKLKHGLFEVSTTKVNDQIIESIELQALTRSVINQFEDFIKLNRKIPIEIMMVIMNTEDSSRLADIIIAHLQLTVAVKQELLEATNVRKRLDKISVILNKEIHILTLEKKIRGRVKDQIDQVQKEYYLREQLKAIQKELGTEEELSEEISELKEKLAKIKIISDSSRKILEKEISKLEKMFYASAESTVSRNYLEWILELPWDTMTKDNNNLTNAEKVLNKDHYGLEKIKERILEFLAVRQRTNLVKGPILCLVGPPGVGKTSLGKSVARALGRKFVRISLGGVRDEAEIRGHRKTYIGAMPGKIIQALHRAKSNNPVFLLDEVDKLANDFRGDPTSALLEILDPEQNNTFTDHYINLPYDLSNVFFITTANIIHTIPAPLRDRMEIIRLSGYTEDEKFHISKLHLIKKQIKENGLENKHVKFNKSAILEIIRKYTRESGVRNLEREIGKICRKRVKEIVVNNDDSTCRITDMEVSKYLGIPRFTKDLVEKTPLVGTVNGLAWTEVGGVMLIVETAMMPGKGKCIITGQIGEVMEESSRAAFTYIKSRAEQLSINEELFNKNDFHIHIPEGATPKDGPSAGITMVIALISLLTDRKVRADIAMTGEITLRGRVLPIGGVKEKVLAALSEGIKNIILPEENRKDLEDIPEKLRVKMNYKFVDNVDKIIDFVLI